MAFRETIWRRRACGDHCRGLHGSRLSIPGGLEGVETNGRHHGCCSLETSAYDCSTNFDFNNVPFKSYANTAHYSYADSSCSTNGFDWARAHESLCNCQASRRAARLHWRT